MFATAYKTLGNITHRSGHVKSLAIINLSARVPRKNNSQI